jgi:1,4-alpha-glucan branching enzyme
MPHLGKKNMLIQNAWVLGLLLFAQQATSQVVWTEPAFPTADDFVTLYYNSGLGNGELEGVIPVYIHTGVITSESSGPSDWQYVQTDWGVGNSDCVLTPGINSFDFNGLTLSDYYAIPEGISIESLAMVFRNASGSLVGRNADGSDIFYEVSTGAFSASIQSPELGYAVLAIGESLELTGQTSEASAMELFLNGQSVTTASGTNLSYTFEAIEPGQYDVLFSANNGSLDASDSATITVLPDTPTTAWPPDGSQDGITYLSDTSVRLQLYAPSKEHVFVVGDFNDWELSFEYLMTPTPDLSRYWIELEGLTPGQEYRFHYHIMPDDLRVADAYSEVVLDPWNDGWISEATFPDMLPFPNMLTANKPVSVFQTAQAEFDWSDASFQRPEDDQLIVYELLVRDFTEERNFQTILDTLDYLDRLGINAIEFMPINEFNGNDSWGYNPTFFLALDKAYGTKNAFKLLVDACHERGIAVILDVVLNHADTPNPFLDMYWNSTLNQPAANNPWFNEVAPTAESWFYDWNHESGATAAFMKRALSYWVDEFHVDGYRLDFSKGMTQTSGSGNGYDQSRIDILNNYADHLWSDDPGIYMILEHWTDSSELQALVEDGFMVWANTSHEYAEAHMGYGSNFNWASYQVQGMVAPRVVSYPESHDEERLMYKALAFGNGEADYQVTTLNTALSRMEAIQCFHIPLPGPKMLYQFEELGYDYSINTCSDGVTVDESCRLAAKPVRWDYRDNANRYRIHEVIAGLAHLKTTYPDPFTTTNYNFDVSGYGKRLHLHGENLNAVIVANFRVTELSMIPGFLHTGTWYDYFTGELVEVTDVNAFMDFAPGEYHVYLDANITAPNSTNVASVTNEASEFEVYPNPASHTVYGSIQLTNMQTCTLKVMDQVGKVIATQAIQPWHIGTHEFSLNVVQWPAGLYYIQCLHNGFSTTRQVIVD